MCNWRPLFHSLYVQEHSRALQWCQALGAKGEGGSAWNLKNSPKCQTLSFPTISPGKCLTL